MCHFIVQYFNKTQDIFANRPKFIISLSSARKPKVDEPIRIINI